MARNILRDGYTRTARINGRPGLYAGLKFTYRPMLDEEVSAVIHRVGDKRAAGHFSVATGIKAAAIVRHLKEWDETDEAGNPVPITGDHVRRLPPPLLGRLFDVISGFDPGDLIEDAAPEEADEYLRSLESVLETGSASTAREDEKNSHAG